MINEILDYWFHQLKPNQWFVQDKAVDEYIISDFTSIHQQAVCGELWTWRTHAEGCLAEIIVLDQFSRNMFRGDAESYLYDSMALTLAQTAVDRSYHLSLPPQQRGFLLMPYMHSESLIIHQQAVLLFNDPGMEEFLKYEYLHQETIKRFGRYPARNKALGRMSTPDEIDYLSRVMNEGNRPF